MAVAVQTIIDSCRIVLNDANGVRWADADFFVPTINEGQRRIVDLVDAAGQATVTFALVEGVHQSLPATALRMIRPIRNMGTNGTTQGAAITECEERSLSAYVPGWMSGAGNATVKHTLRVEGDERAFMVYPPQTVAVSQIEASLVVIPADALLAGNITIPDRYREPLINYSLAQAFMVEGETQETGRAGAFMTAFYLGLGVKTPRQNRMEEQRESDNAG